jgi:hypothetical protein
MAVPAVNRPPIGLTSSKSLVLAEKAFMNAEPRFARYVLTTPSNAATEAFIDGVASFRLKVPEAGILIGHYFGASLATGDDTVVASACFGYFGASNKNGTVAMMTNSPSLTTFPTAAPAVTYAFTADDTNDAVILTITGVSAKPIIHVVDVYYEAVTLLEA